MASSILSLIINIDTIYLYLSCLTRTYINNRNPQEKHIPVSLHLISN
jgi:hypothetical protein